jgi:hypothetical protein
VREHDRVVVHVHDPGLRHRALGHLVSVVGRGQAGADVQELPDAGLGGQVVHRAAEELALRADAGQDRRVCRDDLLGSLAIGGEVVLPAQPVVVDPGDVSRADVDPGRRGVVGFGGNPVLGLRLGHARLPCRPQAHRPAMADTG